MGKIQIKMTQKGANHGKKKSALNRSTVREVAGWGLADALGMWTKETLPGKSKGHV